MLSGISTYIKTLRIGVENIAKVSGVSFARLLGVISPKIKTRTVVAIVASVTPESPKYFVKITVAIDAEAMFTILFPINMLESTLSKSSVSIKVCTALLSPLFARCFILILLMLEKAVSVAEKYADKKSKIPKTIIKVLL
jgi:hypothetical protein